MRQQRSGYTLIEVLWITGICAILASLLLHTMQKVEAAARRTTCVKGLKAALQSWQRGESAETIQDASPPVAIRDSDWQIGYRLLDYRIESQEDEGAGVRCSVLLTIRDPQGRARKTRVVYLVQGGDEITVCREQRSAASSPGH